jgi:hypothetical protein
MMRRDTSAHAAKHRSTLALPDSPRHGADALLLLLPPDTSANSAATAAGDAAVMLLSASTKSTLLLPLPPPDTSTNSIAAAAAVAAWDAAALHGSSPVELLLQSSLLPAVCSSVQEKPLMPRAT